MLLIALFSAYLLGSIPTALLVARKLGGIDIRTVGDGNMGAHNIKAHFGWRAGIIVAARTAVAIGPWGCRGYFNHPGKVRARPSAPRAYPFQSLSMTRRYLQQPPVLRQA